MCTCFGVKDAQGWAWGLEEAPGHLWVVLVGIFMTIKSLMNIWAVSSQVWGVALGSTDRCCICSAGELFLQEQLSSHLGRAVFGLPKPPQQALPAQNHCPRACVWLQSSGVQGLRQGHRNLLSWSPPFIAVLWKWSLEQESPGQGPCLLPGLFPPGLEQQLN